MKDLDPSNWHPHNYFDNVVNSQSFGNGLFDTDDHQTDHPIIANRHRQ
jgi:hypothetical protein